MTWTELIHTIYFDVKPIIFIFLGLYAVRQLIFTLAAMKANRQQRIMNREQ